MVDFPPPAVLFAPADHVPVGGAAVVTMPYVPPPAPGVQAFLSLVVPSQFRVDAAEITPGGSCTATPVWEGTRVACPGVGVEASFVVEVTALEVGNDLLFDASVDIGVFGVATGTVAYSIVDPSIGAEVHPDLQGPAYALVGSPTTFEGAIVTSGSAAMADAVTTLEIGAGLEATSASWTRFGEITRTCSVEPELVTCDMGTLPPYSDTLVAVSVMPVSPVTGSTTTVTVTSSTPEDDPDPHPNVQELVLTVLEEPHAELGVEALVRIDEPTVGVAFGVEVRVTNHGPAPVEEISIDVMVSGPYELSVRSRAPIWAACTMPGDGTAHCDAQSLAVGQTQTLDVTLRATDTEPGAVEISAEPDLPVPDPPFHPSSVLVEFPSALPPNAELVGSIVALSEPFAGQPYRFRLAFQNTGPSIAPEVVATIAVPSSWEVLGASSPCVIVANEIRCDVGIRRPGQSANITVDVRPTEVGADQTATATVTSGLPEPAMTLVLTHTIEVEAPVSDLGDIRQTWGPSTVRVDVPTEVNFRFRNFGPAIAEDVVLTVATPADVMVGFRGVSQDECAYVPPTITCQFDEIVAGQFKSAFLTLTHRSASSPVTYDVAVTSSTPEPDPDPSPNERSFEFTVLPSEPGSVTGTVQGPNPVEGTVVFAYRPFDGFAPTAAALVEEDGQYLFESLPGGEYRLGFLPPAGSGLIGQWAGGSATRAGASAFIVDGLGGLVTRPVTTLTEPSTMTGRIVDGDGAGIAGVEVAVFATSVPFFPWAVTTSGADGNYELTGLIGASYEVRFRAPDLPMTRWYDGASHRSGATSVVVPVAGSVSGVDAVLDAPGP